ncbi:NAD(P)-dependent oxidoreductase [Planctomycetaceae bacterium]|nr:NAD(P)-dependent oxidoreductase [Planctomycetaceae bacterium]
MSCTVAFIGTGIMGSRMAEHLIANGHQLHVHNRTREKARALLEQGAVWHDTPESAAAAGDAVITMLGLPADVEQIYFGQAGTEGVIAASKPGSLLIDMTTSSPHLAERIANAAEERGMQSLDAPVSGGDVGARNASLVVMVGGRQKAFDSGEPLLNQLGNSITLLGPAGSGQRCKLVNQIAVAVGMVAWCEALAVAKAAGLDPSVAQKVISGGAAGSWGLSNLAPRALREDFKPGFLVRHLVKDIQLAQEEADCHGVRLPGLEVAGKLYDSLKKTGFGENGTQVLFHSYGTNKVANC